MCSGYTQIYLCCVCEVLEWLIVQLETAKAVLIRGEGGEGELKL